MSICYVLFHGRLERPSSFRAAIALLLLLATCVTARGDDSVLDRVAARGVLRVGTTGDYPPFSSFDEKSQSWRGIDVALAASLARSLGVRVEFVKTTWASLLDDLSRDRFDIAMGGISVTLARQRVGLFSVPYMDDGKIPIVRRADLNRFSSLRRIDRAGVTVVVNPGGTNERFVRDNVHHARIVVWPDNRTIFSRLLNKTADAMITDRSEAVYQARRHPTLAVVGAPLTRTEKAYLMPRDLVWRAYVDQWLRMTLRDGTFARLYRDEMRR